MLKPQKRIPFAQRVKAKKLINKVLGKKDVKHSFKIGCNKCYGRGYTGIMEKTGEKVPCSCMLKQIDYDSL